MTRRKPKTCRASGCERPMHMGGLCAEHLEEDQRKRAREDRAVEALHRGAELRDPALQAELLALRERWWRVCDVHNSGRGTRTMPADEAVYAISWCIALASEILDADAEPVPSSGVRPYGALDVVRRNVGERFAFLDAGLRSNGTPRTSLPA